MALAGLHFVLGLLLYDPALFPGGDNAGYMILGEALASGQGYRDIYLPLGPLHTKYPPLYPLLLAVFSPLGSLQVLKLTSLVLTTLTVWLAYRLAERMVGRGPAAAAAGLLAVSPVLLEYSHYVLSEALFVALVVAALLWVERAAGDEATTKDGPPGITSALLLGLLVAGAAFLTRTAGLPLLAATVLYFALERSARRFALATGLASASAGGWWLYQRWASASNGGDVAPPTYLREMLLRNPYDPAAGSANLRDLALRGTENLWSYISDVLPRALTGGWGATDAGAAFTVVGLAMAGLAFVGWARRSTSRLGPAELFTVLYAIMLALWPPVWTDQRFLLPLLPLLLAYAASGVWEIGRRISGSREGARTPALAAGALAAFVGTGAVATAFARVPDSIRCLADFRAGLPCDPPEFASFYAAAEWTAANTAPDAIVVSRKPRIFFWISARRGDIYPYSADARVVLQAINRMGADYVVVDAISGTTPRYLVPALRENLSMFEIVHETGDPPTFVLRFDPEPVAAD